jgi:1,4-dihydroxy-2-naphthoate octaprenyltransferase
VRPGSARAWLLACRPATLTAAVVPVLVGSAIAFASGGFRAGPALAALLGAVLIQVATNFANDVYDHEKGADTEARLGPVRAAQAGLLTPRALRNGLAVVIAFSVLPGIYLTYVAGWPIVAIGIASILSGLAYTGGPWPLGYHGLGDVFVMAFFGFVAVCGTAFVQLGAVPPLAWIGAVPVGALATAVLVVNNVRDRETDVVAGKRTLAVRFGRTAGIVEYVVLLLLAYATPFAAARELARPAWVFLPLLSVPVGVKLALTLARSTDGPTLNRCLASTAKLLLLFGALFSVGLVLASR